MSASPSVPSVAALVPPKPRTRGFLHIARHGAGSGTMYVVTYRRLNSEASDPLPRPVLAEGAQSLIELLERVGIDFRLREVREALEDVLRFGSANIPDLWLSEEEIVEKGLVDSQP